MPGVEVALITDLVRDTGPEKGMKTLEAAAEVAAEAGIVGIGIGGSEQSFPPEPFAPVYERARGLGLRTTAHAGEVAGTGERLGRDPRAARGPYRPRDAGGGVAGVDALPGGAAHPRHVVPRLQRGHGRGGVAAKSTRSAGSWTRACS